MPDQSPPISAEIPRTAENVLDLLDWRAAQGFANPAVVAAIRKHYEITGQIADVALRDLNLERVVMYRNPVTITPAAAPPPAGES